MDTHEDIAIEACRPRNRGKKLGITVEEPLSLLTSKPTLWPLIQFHEDAEFVNIGKRRGIRRRIPKPKDCDPYADINIEDIWRLPQKYSDLIQIEPIKDTFRSRHLQLLSREIMRMVEEHGDFLRSLNSLGSLLQGDDPWDHSNLEASLSPETLRDARESNAEMTAVLNEYLDRLQDIRALLIKASLKKKQIALKIGMP